MLFGAASRREESSNADRGPLIELRRFEVELPGLPFEASGVTFAQISDLHRRGDRPDAVLHAAVAAANAVAADYTLVTGDLVDGPTQDILPAVGIVSGLRARLGVYASLGNHDHRGDPRLLTSGLEAAGITVLDNRAVELAPGFWLAGVDDLYEGKPDIQAALRSIPEGAAAILMSHNPGALDLVPQGRPLLILSGHTHGGQIVVRFPPPELICWRHLRTRYVHGWFSRGRVKLYVNRGVGVTGVRPLARRINCPPEIAAFAVRPSEDGEVRWSEAR